VGRDGRTIWIVDAHGDDGKRFVARTDEKLTAFLELERVIHEWAVGGAAARLGTRITKNSFSYEYGQFAIKDRSW
jgi:hypothetical protein